MEEETRKMPTENTPSDSKTVKKQPNSVLKTFILGVLVVVLLGLIGSYFVTINSVHSLSESDFTLRSAEFFHVPVAKINGLNVAYTDYVMDKKSLSLFYATQDKNGTPTPTAEQISDQALSRLMVNRLIVNFATQYNTVVEDQDITDAKEAMMSQFPDEDTAKQEIKKTFGWKLETFVDRIIRPIVLEQKLSGAFATSSDQFGSEFSSEQTNARHILFMFSDDKDKVELKSEAQAVLVRIKNGEDFAELAAQYGSDSTKDNGGDLGWFSKGMMVPEFENVAFSLQPGELNPELVETEFGYHIIQVIDQKIIKDFNAFLESQIRDAKIEILADVHNPFEGLFDEPAPQQEVQEAQDTTNTDELLIDENAETGIQG